MNEAVLQAKQRERLMPINRKPGSLELLLCNIKYDEQSRFEGRISRSKNYTLKGAKIPTEEKESVI